MRFQCKKYEEEHLQVKECFCPKCGYNVSNALNGHTVSSATDAFGDGWLSDLESSIGAYVASMQAQQYKA